MQEVILRGRCFLSELGGTGKIQAERMNLKGVFRGRGREGEMQSGGGR